VTDREKELRDDRGTGLEVRKEVALWPEMRR